jgi:hypothetical protein
VVIADLIPEEFGAKARMAVFVGMLVSVGLFFLQYIPQFVPALQPKSAWIGRILSLHWNFVYPFSGGSGPLGFYISFLFMGLAWIIAFILFAIGFFKKDLRKTMLLMLIPIGLIYNGMFAEEYLFGFVNGSAPKLVSDVTEFIKNDPDIKMVTVYNDNGGAEIQAIGKYRKRLYTDPKFDINEKVKTLNMYKEFYLEVDIPKIDPTSVYRKYLDSCTTVYDKQDHYISAIVHDCRAVPDIILK